MKKVFAGVTLFIVVVVGYFGYQAYTRSAFLATLSPHVKNTSIRLNNAIRIELEPSHVTFKEMFDRLDADIVEVDKHIVEVQSITTERTSALASPSIAYMQAAQEFSRAQLTKFRKMLAFNSAVSRSEDAITGLRTASGYGIDYARKESDRAVEELTKSGEELRASVSGLRSSAEKLKGALVHVSDQFPSDALIPPAKLDAVIQANKDEKKSDDTKK